MGQLEHTVSLHLLESGSGRLQPGWEEGGVWLQSEGLALSGCEMLSVVAFWAELLR